MKRLLVVLFPLLIISCSNPPNTVPVPNDSANGSLGTNPTTPSNPDTPTQPGVPPSTYNIFRDVGQVVGKMIDNYYSETELQKTRYLQATTHKVDTCVAELSGEDSFADRIAWAVEQKLNLTIPRVGYVASYFGLSSTESAYTKTSLLSHPLCTVSISSLNTTFQGTDIPTQAVVDKVNKFVSVMNQYRTMALAGAQDGLLKAHKLWAKLFMCLAYTESLTTADNSSSVSTASRYLASGVAKPPGVSFYSSSLLNLGLYQFDPDSSGEAQSCLREWNDLYPTCALSKTLGQSDMISLFGSSHQTFNAFCGVAKVSGMFGIQVNTKNSKNTFPSNTNSNGTLKAGADRCVTFNMNDNLSYNHFAAFQNGYGNTLNNIMTCTLAGDY